VTIALPDKDLSLEDNERLTDWIELRVLSGRDSAVSLEEFADELHDSLQLEADKFEAAELTPQELAASRIEDAFTNARRRRLLVGNGYPFLAKRNEIRKTKNWSKNLCFTTLLLADIGRFYRNVKTDYAQDPTFCRLFEIIVQACLCQVLGGKSVRFGWPREPDWPTSISDRIHRLAEEMGLVADSPEEKTDPADKDKGLDVATRFSLGDEGPGSLVVLTQCATGRNFQAKENEPPLDVWKSLLRWEARIVRGVAFPWRRDVDERKFGRLALKFEAVFFDRMRLFSRGNPDAHLPDSCRVEIEDWCRLRISEI
jgi:hypothetical protein